MSTIPGLIIPTQHQAPVPAPAPAGAGPRPLVIGIDPSLQSLGIAGADWADALRPTGKGHHRLAWLRAEVADRTKHADLVVIEGPSHGSALQQGHHEMAGLWWMLTHDLWRRHIPYAVCPPDNRTIYATGKARWTDEETGRRLTSPQVKGLVRNAVAERYGIECTGAGRYDKSDAFVLAAVGLHWLGWPLQVVPDTHRRAMTGIAWPTTNVPAAA